VCTWAWTQPGPYFTQADQGSSLNPNDNPNCSKPRSIAATPMKFCDKQRGLSLLLVTAILPVFEQFEKNQEILFDKIGP